MARNNIIRLQSFDKAFRDMRRKIKELGFKGGAETERGSSEGS